MLRLHFQALRGNAIGRRYFSKESDFISRFIRHHKPPHEALKYFSALDWTRGIFQNDKYEPVAFFPRYVDKQTGENTFFGSTVNTPATIPRLLALRRKALGAVDPETSSVTATEAAEGLHGRSDALCLMTLKEDLHAHPSIVHGGFQGVIFDEIMRFVILLHYDRTAQPGPRRRHYTLQMSLSYHAPVLTGGDILVRSWLTRREGRKWFLGAEIVDPANRDLTSAESMWLTGRTET
ncbi:HotDog domain-containing protein [Aspergillus avenaceus]|uniref:HotDog domain-containing protein n=1 Tax=Aspergillus avenaceus TaxID=36643 RepID=A0A5N6U9P1_ASPAV|nr:HotDog domain-containing protein [Aspergillus avenaceus]